MPHLRLTPLINICILFCGFFFGDAARYLLIRVGGLVSSILYTVYSAYSIQYITLFFNLGILSKYNDKVQSTKYTTQLLAIYYRVSQGSIPVVLVHLRVFIVCQVCMFHSISWLFVQFF